MPVCVRFGSAPRQASTTRSNRIHLVALAGTSCRAATERTKSSRVDVTAAASSRRVVGVRSGISDRRQGVRECVAKTLVGADHTMMEERGPEIILRCVAALLGNQDLDVQPSCAMWRLQGLLKRCSIGRAAVVIVSETR